MEQVSVKALSHPSITLLGRGVNLTAKIEVLSDDFSLNRALTPSHGGMVRVSPPIPRPVLGRSVRPSVIGVSSAQEHRSRGQECIPSGKLGPKPRSEGYPGSVVPPVICPMVGLTRLSQVG